MAKNSKRNPASQNLNRLTTPKPKVKGAWRVLTRSERNALSPQAPAQRPKPLRNW